MNKRLTVSLFSLLLSCSVFAGERSQCGSTDERVLSYEKPFARMLKDTTSPAGCTGTMISKSCVVSAGHCYSSANIYEFNTVASINGSIVHPESQDIYTLSQVIGYRNGGQGNDWFVGKLNKNPETGLYPGEAQGFLEVSYEVPAAPLDITIIGYGRDRRSDRNFAQQIASNELVRIDGNILSHNIDTQGGNSGSSIIERSSNKIIGIHTHGGCSSYNNYGANKGTMLAKHAEFKAAIEKCLSSEN